MNLEDLMTIADNNNIDNFDFENLLFNQNKISIGEYYYLIYSKYLKIDYKILKVIIDCMFENEYEEIMFIINLNKFKKEKILENIDLILEYNKISYVEKHSLYNLKNILIKS